MDFLIAEGMMNPTISSKGMVSYMKSNPMAPNRFQDIWVWNGRPNWDEIFQVRHFDPCRQLINLRVRKIAKIVNTLMLEFVSVVLLLLAL